MKVLKLQILNNSHGQCLISLLVSLPLILTLLGFQKHVLSLIRNRTKSLAICREHLWEIQFHSRESLVTLLSMNPQAINLRLERKKAEKTYKTAILSGFPKAILLAKLNLLRVISHQTAFRNRQLEVLNSLNIKIQHTKKQIELAIDKAGIKEYKIYIPSLQVKTHPAKSLSPNYITKNSFSNVQASYAHWSVQSLGWKKKFDLHCGVTLTKENNLWDLALIERDKP